MKMQEYADEEVHRIEEFMETHASYRESIPPSLKLPKSVDKALDRIWQAAVIEKHRILNLMKE